jgi:hypothetical protein
MSTTIFPARKVRGRPTRARVLSARAGFLAPLLLISADSLTLEAKNGVILPIPTLTNTWHTVSHQLSSAAVHLSIALRVPPTSYIVRGGQ